jgi:ABC-type phosphate transport system substrate-binding protein
VRAAAISRLILLVAIGLALGACSGETTDSTEVEPASSNTTATSTAVAGESSLVGQWERAESTFTSLDGMIIEVQGDGTSALILTVPENEYQFAAGDEKWSDIESTGDGEYTFQDLVREENTGATSYVEGIITVGGDGNTLVMTFPTTGTNQEWVRVDGS